MEEYLRNILPRLKRYSNQLNKVEMFIEKPWIKYNENDRIEYTFERNNRLVIAKNGNALRNSSWELLSTAKLLIKKEDGDELLEPVFIDNNIFILIKPNESIQLFINETVVKKDIKNYLESILKNKELPIAQSKYDTDYTSLLIFTFLAALIFIIMIFSNSKK
jgi:hypothetical protein